jgi:hypothetical protein
LGCRGIRSCSERSHGAGRMKRPGPQVRGACASASSGFGGVPGWMLLWRDTRRQHGAGGEEEALVAIPSPESAERGVSIVDLAWELVLTSGGTVKDGTKSHSGPRLRMTASSLLVLDGRLFALFLFPIFHRQLSAASLSSGSSFCLLQVLAYLSASEAPTRRHSRFVQIFFLPILHSVNGNLFDTQSSCPGAHFPPGSA